MADRSRDWLAQAQRNLDQALDSAQAGRHEWACFAAQQAAEFAVKALHLHYRQEAWGHVIRELLASLPQTVAVPPEFPDLARALDAYYVPTRYPNGHASGIPGDHYGALQSRQACDHAGTILEFCRDAMARTPGSPPGADSLGE